ncbi:putative nucleic acid-binding protein [Lupinus albus]|uniref:DNA-directed RNA polymerase subunit n=1 Tax=Lupinus albus TaxID=3870 RepID=A0A6A4R7Z3_LUPAL|nr:putative nucleic acid-binding protein [Lupinus albus]
MEGLKVSNANLVVYIHPSKSREFSQALLRELSSLLFTYNESFDGVVLAYDPDMFLEGKVVKLTQESIHVVVLGFSSAIITEKFIRDDLVYKTKRGQNVYASKSHKRHVIKVGAMIRFLVKSFDEEILHICGSLDPDHTGSINWLDKKSEIVFDTDRSSKKRQSEAEPLILEQDAVVGERARVDGVQKIKNSKKLKIRKEF